MSLRSLRTIVQQTFSDWNDHDAPRLGAALAFYMILSLAPLLVLSLSGVALVFGRSASESEFLNQAQSVIGSEGTNALRAMIKDTEVHQSRGLASLLGLATLVFGASGVFVELRSALNTIWCVRSKSSSGFMTIVEERFFSFGMVLAVGLLLLVSLLLGTTLAALGKFFNELLPLPEVVLAVVNSAASLVAISILFALIFKYVPETRTPWREAWIGGAVSALLFTIGNALIGLYLGKAGIGSAYGAAGSLIVIIVWVYYSAQVFFLGAEFTHVLAEDRRRPEIAKA
jgi:membrane protein